MSLVPSRKSPVTSQGEETQSEASYQNVPQRQQLQLQNRHHRHGLTYDYIPYGNEDMNSPENFPQTPDTPATLNDRVFSDPYRHNMFVIDENHREVHFTDIEAQDLLTRRRRSFVGKFSMKLKRSFEKTRILAIIHASGSDASKRKYSRDRQLVRAGQEIDRRHDQFTHLQNDKRLGRLPADQDAKATAFTQQAQDLKNQVRN